MMKNFTPILGLGLIAAVAVPAAAQADFTQSETHFTGGHRSAAVMADFRNVGRLDIFNGGQLNDDYKACNHEWQEMATWYKNDGMNEFTIDGVTFKQNVTVDEDGNESTVWAAVAPEHGVRTASFVQYGAFDYNNDGLVDLLLMGTTDWDVVMPQEERLTNTLYLYKNLGNEKFELVADAVFPRMSSAMRACPQFNLAIGDYDRDGYTDFLVASNSVSYEGMPDDYPTQGVFLYRNLGGTGRFENMPIAETKGGVWTTPVITDAGEVIVEAKELKGWFLPMSGNVHMIDLNNDGWLDIICIGQADNNWDGIHVAGDVNTGKIYLNRNGEKFEDVTPESRGFTTLRNSGVAYADFDRDGYLDLFQTGWSAGTGGAGSALFYYNNCTEKEMFNDLLDHIQIGVDGAESLRPFIRDFDGDGYLDIYYSGGWGAADPCSQVFYGNMMGTFTKGSGLPNYRDGAGCVGDMTGNGLSDIFMFGYSDSGPTVGALFYNTTDYTPEAPEAPETVTAVLEDGKLNISWTYDEDTAIENDLVYNLFVKDSKGNIYCVLPADPETGFVKVSYNRVACIRPMIKEYSIPAVEGEEYTVGVQAISTANETYSAFTVTEATAGVISAVADENGTPEYFNLQGIRVADPQPGNIYIERVNGVAKKIVK